MSRTGKKGGGSGGLGRAILKERSRGKRTHDAGSWVSLYIVHLEGTYKLITCDTWAYFIAMIQVLS